MVSQIEFDEKLENGIFCKDLAYAIGVLEGDGYLDKNSFGLQTKDKDFALNFKNAVENSFGKECKLHFYNGLWRVLLHSRFVVKFLNRIDYHIFKNLPVELKCAFLKGMYDSEGSAYYMAKIGVRNRKLEICNTNLDLMLFCRNLLQELNVKTNKIDKRIRKTRMLKGRKLSKMIFYRFQLSENKENFILFRNLINFSIVRKQKQLDKIIDSYIYPNRNKWLTFKHEVLLKRKEGCSYSQLRRDYHFIPRGVLEHWIYSRVSENE